MAHGYEHQATHNKTRIAKPERTHTYEPRRAQVFSLRPLALRELLERDRDDSEHREEELDAQAEDIGLDDVDIDSTELAEEPSAVEFEDGSAEQEAGGIEREYQFDLEPAINPDDWHILRVLPGPAGTWQCRYQAKSWLRRGDVPDGYDEPVAQMNHFLRAISAWFTNEATDFLRNPSAASFAKAQRGFEDDAIATQKGLLARVCKDPPSSGLKWPGSKTTETWMTRLKDTTLLVWPETALPLSRLFSEEFRLAWAVAGCLAYSDDGRVWEAMKDRRFTRDDYREARRERDQGVRPARGFDAMQASEIAAYFCGVAKVGWDRVLAALTKTIKAGVVALGK